MEDEVYVCILRGINVSGKNIILMNDLKLLFQKLKFKNVLSYIQSGNILFSSAQKLADEKLADKISKEIFQRFNLIVPVIIRKKTEIKNTVSSNPFLKQKEFDLEKMHVTFLSDNPDKSLISLIDKNKFLPDDFIISGKEIYIYCPSGYGNTKLNNTFFENKLKQTATTRNWKTVNKLLELSENLF